MRVDVAVEENGPPREEPPPAPQLVPSPRLSGVDEDDAWESNVVRGID